MIALISRWQLRDGCPPKLERMLFTLAERVRSQEPGTLTYVVHMRGPVPLDAQRNPIEPPPRPLPSADQTEVIFYEQYADAKAFSEHVKGELFNEFRLATLKYFKEDPEAPGWPLRETEFLTIQSSFARELG